MPFFTIKPPRPGTPGQHFSGRAKTTAAPLRAHQRCSRNDGACDDESGGHEQHACMQESAAQLTPLPRQQGAAHRAAVRLPASHGLGGRRPMPPPGLSGTHSLQCSTARPSSVSRYISVCECACVAWCACAHAGTAADADAAWRSGSKQCCLGVPQHAHRFLTAALLQLQQLPPTPASLPPNPHFHLVPLPRL